MGMTIVSVPTSQLWKTHNSEGTVFTTLMPPTCIQIFLLVQKNVLVFRHFDFGPNAILSVFGFHGSRQNSFSAPSPSLFCLLLAQ